MFSITINGETKDLEGELTVAELVARLGFEGSRVAVEVNREVVPRTQHAQHRLEAGDEVEIVTFVGGGS